MLSHNPAAAAHHTRARRLVWRRHCLGSRVIINVLLFYHLTVVSTFLPKSSLPIQQQFKGEKWPETTLLIFSSYKNMSCKIVYKSHSSWSIQNASAISKIVAILLFQSSIGIWPMFHHLIPGLPIPSSKNKGKPRVKGYWLSKNLGSNAGSWNFRRLMSPGFHSCCTC